MKKTHNNIFKILTPQTPNAKLILSYLDTNIINCIESVNGGTFNKKDSRGGHIDARNKLIYLLNNLPDKSLLWPFLIKTLPKFENCAKKVNGELVSELSYWWKDLTLNTLPKDFGGTYLFKQTLTNESYIGSTNCIYNRALFHQRLFKSKGKKRQFALHKSQWTKLETLTFSIINKTPNFIKLWEEENKDKLLNLYKNKGEHELLILLSSYPARVIEQKLIDTFKPSINGGVSKSKNSVVAFNYAKLDVRVFNKPFNRLFNSIPVVVYDESYNELFEFKSKKEAVKFLGLSSDTHISRYIGNTSGRFVPKLNKLFKINIKNGKWEDRILTPKKIKQVVNLNRPLTSLSLTYTYLIDITNNLNFFVFFNQIDLFTFLFPNKFEEIKNKTFLGNYISRIINSYLNTNVPIKAESGQSYYYCMHPDRFNKKINPVWQVNINTGLAILYPSLKYPLELLKIEIPRKTFSAYTEYCVDNGKLLGDKKDILFISYKKLSSIVTELNNNNRDIEKLQLTTEQLLLVKKIKIGRSRLIYVYDKTWNLINNGKPFKSIVETSNSLNIPKSTISTALTKKNLCKDTYYFRYETIESN